MVGPTTLLGDLVASRGLIAAYLAARARPMALLTTEIRFGVATAATTPIIETTTIISKIEKPRMTSF